MVGEPPPFSRLPNKEPKREREKERVLTLGSKFSEGEVGTVIGIGGNQSKKDEGCLITRFSPF